MKKSWIKITAFIILLAFILAKTNRILSFKFGDGNTIINDFYTLPNNTANVLVIGSSHAYVSFNCGTLWDNYGIAAYDLASSMQPMWNSYYYLKEGLKTQKPELIILEGYGTSFDWNFFNDSTVIKNTYGMKWSLNKYQAICESVDKKDRLAYLLDYTRYHNRYTQLNRGDFFPSEEFKDTQGAWHYTNTMGQYLFDFSAPIEFADTIDSEEIAQPLESKTEVYYRKILQLASDNDIPIIVIVTPHVVTETQRRKYLRAAQIAEEYNVEFFNANSHIDEINFDTDSAYVDIEHMSASGSNTFSIYIGDYIKKHYSLTDHRGEEKYQQWDQCAQYTKQFIQNQELKSTTEYNDMLPQLNNPNYYLFITCNRSGSSDSRIPDDFLYSQNVSASDNESMWCINSNHIIWKPSETSMDYYISTPLHDICLYSCTDSLGNHNNKIVIDQKQYPDTENSLTVVVFDILTDRVVDSFTIDNTYQIIR